MINKNITPDVATIKQHLHHITRRWNEIGEAALLELVFLSADDKARVRQVMHYAPDPDGIELAASDAVAWNKQTINVYATVNPVSKANRPEAHKRAKAENILGSFFHWADGDDKQAAANIRGFVGPKSTFFVVTGTVPSERPHVYWELEDFTRNMDAWERTQRAIAATLKTDPSVVDPPRIMRVAGCINWPKPQKQAKGYVAEITTLKIKDAAPIAAEAMSRAFPTSNVGGDADGFPIDTGGGRSAHEFEEILRRARTDGEKHSGVRDLAASLAGQGVNRSMAEAIIRQSCPVWDEGVEKLIETAYAKYYSAPPEPIEATPEVIADFRIDDSDAFLADLEPLEYLIDGVLPRGVVYSLTGHAGHGKTTLALQFALSVAQGEDFHGRECAQGSVLILAGENPYNVKYQYAAALAARNIKRADIHFVQGRFSIEQWTEVLRAKMDAMPSLKLVIVDSLQAFFEGDNDNDNSQMVAMAHKVRTLGDVRNRPAMLVIAHPAGKTPSKDNLVPRGGGAFLNEIDGNLTVWSQDASQQTLHHSQKFRGAGFDPIEWVMQVHEFDHLADIKGVPLKLPVSRPETTSERSQREETSDTFLRRYLEAVASEQPLSVREMASQFRITRYRAETIQRTAKDEKLIRRYAKTYVITDGGKDFLEAENGVL